LATKNNPKKVPKKAVKAPVKAAAKLQPWSTKELNRVSGFLAKGMTLKEIAAKLNRTVGSVQTKIHPESLRS
jgi:DNA-binding NarL/FixJ family response regulator